MSNYTLNGKTVDYDGPEMTGRREKFNRIINGIDMVLMNNITEVDQDIMYGDWLGESPMDSEDCEWFVNDATEPAWCCETHMFDGTGDYPAKDEAGDDSEHPDDCDFKDGSEYAEVYQWFAVNDNDAQWLADHKQYVAYSSVLDTYFLAITHFGTSWDYVDSMVNDILGDK